MGRLRDPNTPEPTPEPEQGSRFWMVDEVEALRQKLTRMPETKHSRNDCVCACHTTPGRKRGHVCDPAAYTHVQVSNPRNPIGPLLYSGKLVNAGQTLAAGDYVASWFVSGDSQGRATLTVADDTTATLEKD